MHPMIDELLNRWEESFENGEPLSAEELCQNHPELLDELRWQINALEAVDARFGNSTLGDEVDAATEPPSTKLNQTVQISTEFHIDRLHASGGLGEVYLASDPLLHRTVAASPRRSSSPALP